MKVVNCPGCEQPVFGDAIACECGWISDGAYAGSPTHGVVDGLAFFVLSVISTITALYGVAQLTNVTAGVGFIALAIWSLICLRIYQARVHNRKLIQTLRIEFARRSSPPTP